MPTSPVTQLRRLEKIRDRFDPPAAAEKAGLIRRLGRRRFARATDLYRFHEVLAFLHAYPDNPEVRREAAAVLTAFDERSDTRRFARRLADTGVAGAPIRYPFYWSTARWLVENWPDRVRIDWPEFARRDRLEELLSLLLPFTETLALDEVEDLDLVGWLELLKGRAETDASFVLRRARVLAGDDFVREHLFEDLELPLWVEAGPGTPRRSGTVFAPSPVVYQQRALDRSRPDLREECRRSPLAVRPVSRREAERLTHLAAEAMVTRARDLYSFRFADPRDVRMVECGDGLQFAAIGLAPERRLMLDSVYGFLTLKNGVPIGYVLVSALFNSAEVAYNVFETYRGGESARVYGRVLAMTRHLFGADAFTVDPYQLGHDNEEGLRSGAWWFYYKLGFRPLDRDVLRLVAAERRRLREHPGRRTTLAMLQRISAANVFLFLGRPRRDVRGLFPLGRVGLAVSRYLGRRFGADRERGLDVCAEEAAARLGVRGFRGWSREEMLWWRRWGPLVAVLPGLSRWSGDDRRRLVAVIRAKGGRYESDYVRLVDGHRPFRRAVARLAERTAARGG